MSEAVHLPSEMANEELGSGSGEEMRKKAKEELVDMCQFSWYEGFEARYGETYTTFLGWAIWGDHEKKLRRDWEIREVRFFLKSQGRVEEANKIEESVYDDLVYSVLDSSDFRHKSWCLRPDPGPYNAYQRLFISSSYLPQGDAPYWTYDCDIAFQKLSEDLQCLTWDLNWSDASKIAEDASKNYKDLEPEILYSALQETVLSKKLEQLKKEQISLLTRLWREHVKKGRDALEVINGIKDKETAAYPLYTRFIQMGLQKFQKEKDVEILAILGRIKSSAERSNWV